VLIGRPNGDEPVFEIWGPYQVVEDEDIAPELLEFVSAPCWTLQVHIQSDPPKNDWSDANNFVRYIAQDCGGAVYYQELGEVVWPKPKRGRLDPETAPLVDLVKLEWLVHVSEPTIETAGLLLDLIKDRSPEVLPIRFGFHEPMEVRLEAGNFSPFLNARKKGLDEWRQGRLTKDFPKGVQDFPSTLLFFKSKRPCFGGHVAFPPMIGGLGRKPTEQFVRISLNFDRAQFDLDPAWCERTVGLFTDVANNLRAFYGNGYVERYWSTYRGLSGTPSTDHHPATEQYPLPIGHEWYGIPPAPTWLLWLGVPYKELVRESFQNSNNVMLEEGILIRQGPTPMDLDQLQGLAPSFPSRLLAQTIGEPWLREKGGRRYYRGRPAEFIPRLDA
jgi:hypothetical protein